MSICSANATALPDRRLFLSTLTAASALGLAAAPALADAAGPIEAMWPEHLRLEAALDVLSTPWGNAEERYEEPDRPLWRSEDVKGSLADLEAWRAEVSRRKDAAGLPAAEAAYMAAGEKAAEHRAAILAIEATTIRELAFQAAVLCIDPDPACAEKVLERFVELAGVTPYSVA